MENSTFGKTIQSKRKQRNIKLVTNEKKKKWEKYMTICKYFK